MKKPKAMPVKKITNNFAPLPAKQLADKGKDKKKPMKKEKEPSMAEYAAKNPHKR